MARKPRDYKAENAKRKEYFKAYRQVPENKERFRITHKRWRHNNQDKVREINRKRYYKDHEASKKYQRDRYKRLKEEKQEQNKID